MEKLSEVGKMEASWEAEALRQYAMAIEVSLRIEDEAAADKYAAILMALLGY